MIIVECILLGLIVGAFGAVMTAVNLYLIRRKLSYKRPKLPKTEFISLGGIVIFVGGIVLTRPLVVPVSDALCNSLYFCIAATLLLGASAKSMISVIIWCAKNSPR
jgi:hypothetical protein